MRRPPAILIVAMLASCGGGSQSPVTGEPLATYTVERGDLDVAVEESGRLTSAKPVLIQVIEGGKILTVVAEGTQVKKGDLLIGLESKTLIDEAETTRMDIGVSQRLLVSDAEDIRLYAQASDKALADAKRALRFARLALEQYRDGKAPLDRQDREIEVRRSAVELTDADEKAKRMPGLLEKGFVNPAELRQAELDAEAKRQAARKAKNGMDFFDRFEQPQQLAKLEADVSGAEIALASETQQVESKRQNKAEELKREEAKLIRLKEKSAKFDERIANLRIVAPSDGVVVYGDPEARYGETTRLEVGLELSAGMQVMSLPDLSAMVAEASVSESNVARIAAGMPATVTVEGLGDRTFHGTVGRIAITAIQAWMEAKRYRTTVTLDDAQGAAFRPDMTCRVRIRIAKLADVVQVPIDAVSVREGKAWCWVKTTRGREKRTIELGQSSDAKVEVKSGLAPGEECLLFAVEPHD